MSLEALSTELQQGILGYLDIISLLNIKHTSKIWRDRVNTALSKPNIILPARAKLLELYLELPRRPSYRHPDPIPPFLGAEYLSNLRAEIAQHAPTTNLAIPAEFEIWILEWPHIAPVGFTTFAEDYGYGNEDGIGCLDPKKILAHASPEEDSPIVGTFLSSHGCQDWSVLLFEARKESDGAVWKGDVWDMKEALDDWDEDECFAASWVDWLRGELTMENNRW